MATGTFDMAKELNDTVTGVSAPGAGSPGAAGAAGLVAAPGAAAGAPAEGGAAAGAGAQALPSHPPSSKRTHRARIVGPPSRVAAERWSSRATRVSRPRRGAHAAELFRASAYPVGLHAGRGAGVQAEQRFRVPVQDLLFRLAREPRMGAQRPEVL